MCGMNTIFYQNFICLSFFLNIFPDIGSKTAECDYKSIQREAFGLVDAYNQQLQMKLATQSAL